MSKQQTAVEWLVQEIRQRMITIYREPNGATREVMILNLDMDLEKFKEMEKEQIIEAWDKGDYCVDLPDGGFKQKYESGEQYYNETYGD